MFGGILCEPGVDGFSKELEQPFRNGLIVFWFKISGFYTYIETLRG